MACHSALHSHYTEQHIYTYLYNGFYRHRGAHSGKLRESQALGQHEDKGTALIGAFISTSRNYRPTAAGLYVHHIFYMHQAYCHMQVAFDT